MRSLRSVTGDDIRQRLQAAGKRQKDLAEYLGVTQGAVSAKLAGRRPFTVTEVEATADFLGIHPGELFNAPPTPPKPRSRKRVSA